MIKKPRPSTARRRVLRGDPTEFVCQACSLPKGSRVLLAIRESNNRDRQVRRKWDDQEAFARDRLAHYGLEVVDVKRFVLMGKHPDLWLPSVVENAVRLGVDAIVFESIDRIARSHTYNPYEQSDQRLNVRECEVLKQIFKGMKVATLEHPSKIGRSIETRRGDYVRKRQQGDLKAVWSALNNMPD